MTELIMWTLKNFKILFLYKTHLIFNVLSSKCKYLYDNDKEWNWPKEEVGLKWKSVTENWKVGCRLKSVLKDVEQSVPESENSLMTFIIRYSKICFFTKYFFFVFDYIRTILIQFKTLKKLLILARFVHIKMNSLTKIKSVNLALAFSANTVPSLPRPFKSFSKFSNEWFSFSFTKK